MSDTKTTGTKEEPSAYPGIFHVSVIAGKETRISDVEFVLSGYTLVSPVGEGEGSPSGKFRSIRFSVSLSSRDEMDRMDSAIRAIPGVKMLL